MLRNRDVWWGGGGEIPPFLRWLMFKQLMTTSKILSFLVFTSCSDSFLGTWKNPRDKYMSMYLHKAVRKMFLAILFNSLIHKTYSSTEIRSEIKCYWFTDMKTFAHSIFVEINVIHNNSLYHEWKRYRVSINICKTV